MFALWNRGDEAHNKVVIFKKWMLNEVCLLKTTMYNRAAHNDVSVDAWWASLNVISQMGKECCCSYL